MIISFFKSVKSPKGEICTYELFTKTGADPALKELCKKIADEEDHDRRSELKKQLPIVTWNASFEGARKNDNAHPSGLFMYDGDGIENPGQFYCERVAGRRQELGILYAGMTPSRHGLRLVAKCRPEFTTIAECQKWLGDQIGWECDPACKDWARASYMVPEEYIYYLDAKGLFQSEPEVVYSKDSTQKDFSTPLRSGRNDNSFKGIPLKDIATEWFRRNGGEPVEGERNSKLYKLALQLRHITDYNEQTLLDALPSYGLAESEMKSLIHSACTASRTSMPKDLENMIDEMLHPEEPEEADDEDFNPALNSKLPNLSFPLPPLFRQFASIAPDDFLNAVILCLLPLLGALGSKLRAKYLDGRIHSPSFQVSLEAPQASGKSFMTWLADIVLAPIIAHDEEERMKEQEYNEKLSDKKFTGIRPKGIIRNVPATISITKLLIRMENARGLHLVAVCEEIDTVTKAFKRGFSNYSELLRVAFDNGKYGQDYATETSYSGIVNARYNTLFSGTPKAMRRFYPDVEDGVVSRVCFATLPDQFGKPMPVWGELTDKARKEIENQIERLNSVSIVGNVVQNDHIMDLDFLNRNIKQWITEQQQEAVRTNDRTRDTFCRRAAVVGFRAGMLAWFLYGEKDTPSIRKKTTAFARWIANQMLTQHLLRFQVDTVVTNTNRWVEAYQTLNDVFTREDVKKALIATGSVTPVKNVISRWRLLGCIEPIVEDETKPALQFKKVKQ